MQKQTALYDFHLKHKGRIVEFAGWMLPVMYSSIIGEHMAVRESAGLFDVSHMGQCEVRGADATDFLNFALTNDFSNVRLNMGKYSLLCNENGECLDDLIAYKLADNRWLLVINASNTKTDIEHLQSTAAESGMKVEVEGFSQKISMLAIQGPKSAKILNAVLGKDFSSLAKYEFANFGGMIISRTGYTGSDGFEIICHNKDAAMLAEKAVEFGAKPCGLGARDSLRLEARYPLYGHELSKEINPYEAGLGWAVKLNKNFIGRNALAAKKESGLKRKVAYFKAKDRRIVREGEKIYFQETEAGRVLSGAWSPMQNAPILSALADIDFLDKPLCAKVRGTEIALEQKATFI